MNPRAASGLLNLPVLCALITYLSLLGLVSAVLAQAPYPQRIVKIVVPFAAGAGTDAMGHLMAQKMGEALGGTFVVENRIGASGASVAIGTQSVPQSAPDGYTLLLLASPFTTVAATAPGAFCEPLRQFAPIDMIAHGPLVWAASPRLQVRNMQELVAVARGKPGALNYGSAGSGGWFRWPHQPVRPQPSLKNSTRQSMQWSPNLTSQRACGKTPWSPRRIPPPHWHAF